MRHKAGGPYLGPRLWSLVQRACPPDSATARGELMADIWQLPGHTEMEHSAAALLPLELPTDSSEGYVANWTVATDVCRTPRIQGLHGGFVAPKAMNVTRKLFPLFSTSKISASNEILIPSFSSFNSSNATSPLPWKEKEPKLHWRGPASGGANSELNWRRLQRHRFVSMLNATHVEVAEGMLHAGNETTVGTGYAGNFRLLPSNAYHLASQKGAKMAEWVSGWADAGFTDLRCDESGEDGTCSYTNEFFSVKKAASDGEEKYKYAAVLDSDAGDDGGELVQRLEEGRVVLRASVYKQWHDSRLIPWLHFVPMDNTFVDVYGVMEYFLGADVPGNEKSSEHGHDEQAQRIAEAGQQWAKKALRKDDALVYLYRLLLEYARVVDVKRHTMGWVGDNV
ncbi:glycosyltransferase family 90 protein, partial [Karstenula rhodostoma CBS 690.94]